MSLAQKLPPKLRGKAVIEQLPAHLKKRAVLVQNQAARRFKKEKNTELRKGYRNYREELAQFTRNDAQSIRAERKNRREDLILGPLAPKRDAGENSLTYGTISTRKLYRPEKKSGWKEYGIVAGDRVVVVQKGHPERGRIGKVREVREKAEELFVEGFNKVTSFNRWYCFC